MNPHPAPTVAAPRLPLLSHPLLWRGRQSLHFVTHSSGHVPLDELLPGGGWPAHALTELLLPRAGVGELSLLMPLLIRLSRQGRRLAWVGSPHPPHPPALAQAGIDLRQLLLLSAQKPQDRLWALEQILRSGCCAAVLGWIGKTDPRSLRRLQLAAEQGRALAFLLRPLSAREENSPAALRLCLLPRRAGLELQVLKCRGLNRPRPLRLPPLFQDAPLAYPLAAAAESGADSLARTQASPSERREAKRGRVSTTRPSSPLRVGRPQP